jgi:1-acyl-sn-glycerol-3-phosphate acyltransferase
MANTPGKSLALSLKNVAETALVCGRAVLDATLGDVEKASYDARIGDWSQRLVRNAQVEIDVVGRTHMLPNTTYLVMSNHLSLYDVPVLFVSLGTNLRMIAKKELFAVPVFGHAMQKAGFVNIDRRDRAQAIASLKEAQRLLVQGTSVWIAPEGTRSKTGKLLPFKKGGFHLALETNWPILPVTLLGTQNILQAKGVRSTPGQTVTVLVHPPVAPGPFLVDASGDLRQATEALLGKVRHTIEGPLLSDAPPQEGST